MGKVVVGVAAVTVFGDKHHHVRLRFLPSGGRCIRIVRIVFGNIGECRLDGAIDGDIEIVDGASLLPAAPDYRSVINLFANHDEGRAHRHDVRAELDFCTAVDRGITRFADRCTHDGMNHVGGIGSELGTFGGEHLNVGSKRKSC